MDTIQIIIMVSLIAITTIIIIGGVYFIKLLKDLSLSLKKTNLILDDAHSITDSVAKPISSASEFIMGLKNGFSFFKNLTKDKKEE